MTLSRRETLGLAGALTAVAVAPPLRAHELEEIPLWPGKPPSPD